MRKSRFTEQKIIRILAEAFAALDRILDAHGEVTPEHEFRLGIRPAKRRWGWANL